MANGFQYLYLKVRYSSKLFSAKHGLYNFTYNYHKNKLALFPMIMTVQVQNVPVNN